MNNPEPRSFSKNPLISNEKKNLKYDEYLELLKQVNWYYQLSSRRTYERDKRHYDRVKSFRDHLVRNGILEAQEDWDKEEKFPSIEM